MFREPLCQPRETLSSCVDVTLRRLVRFLLKAVQNVNRILDPYVNHSIPEIAVLISQFETLWKRRTHRFRVQRLQALLEPSQVVP